ncbi:MAG: phosphocholine cytidylyltransferase family protein [Spirochaetota bacterium]
MRAIILAAGRGTRISRHIGGKAKCTVPLAEGVSLIRYTVTLLRDRGIDDIVLVLGYEAGSIKEALEGLPVTYRVNPFFDVTNSIASLWFVRDLFDARQPFIIMNGDVFLSDEALGLVLAERRSPVLFYDTTRREDADYRFFCSGDRLLKYGKDLSLEETSGEYVGCAVFSGGYAAMFRERLEALIASQRHSAWWEDVLYSMSAEQAILVKDVAGAFWGEVDFVEDYERIMDYYKREVGSGAASDEGNAAPRESARHG